MKQRSLVPILKPGIAKLTGRSIPLPPKQVDPRYQGDDHLAWRRMVIARAGHCCERCGRSGVRLFADHITELRDGGNPLELANGQALCGSCHTIKTMQAKFSR